MAWINIEVMGSGSKPSEIDSVKICTDDRGEPVLFGCREEADNWLWKNSESGAVYWTEEIWG